MEDSLFQPEVFDLDFASSPKSTSIAQSKKRQSPKKKRTKGAKKVKLSETVEEGTKAIRFSTSMDLDLLKEVCSSKPFQGKYKEVPKKWEELTKELNWPEVTVKTVRRRFDLLHKKFLTDELKSLNSSGSEEEYDEKHRLLTDIDELMKSTENPVQVKDEGKDVAEFIRNAAIEGMVKSANDSEGADEDIRCRNKMALAKILQEKNKQESDLKDKKLEFEREKFSKNLEQQIFDRDQREADRKLELRRIEALEKANENQHLLMMKLLENFTK